MPWAKIDDGFTDHPKVIEAGPLASWLYVCGLTYCARLLTDGFVPTGQVRKLADVDGAMELADKLVSVGLWTRVEGGFQIHDYLEYNPSAEKVKAERKAAQERMQRVRSGEVRANNGRSSGAGSEEVQPPRPVPSPSRPNPVPTPEKENVDAPAAQDNAPAAPVRVVALPTKPPQSLPYAAWMAFGEATGLDIKAASPQEKGKSLKAAERLLEAEFTVEDIRACAAFLASQTWRTSLLSMATVEAEIGKWRMAGKPAAEKSRASPSSKNNNPQDMLDLSERYRRAGQ